MSERVSALMDGEHGPEEFAAVLEDLRGPGEALETWRSYHLISDALHDTRLASPGFVERLQARLQEEPTVLSAARRAPRRAERERWMPLYAAASVAAVALVGWVAFNPATGGDAPNFARGAGASKWAVAPKAASPVAAAAGPVAIAEPVQLPLSSAANDYLLAHQAYSPRNSFQGVAPYVRTVSDRAGERGR